MRKIVLALAAACIAAAGVQAQQQQITRFALVDLTRVYSALFADSRAVKDLEARSAAVQADINRMTEELQGLRSDHAEAVAAGDQRRAQRLQNDIQRKQTALVDFHTSKTAELEAAYKALADSNAFPEEMYSDIRYVAEREGYSMVIDANTTPGILWYSATVDITDKLIERMRERQR